MLEYGIVVRHIDVNDITVKHIELMRQYNPNVPIETISGNIPFKNGLAANKLHDLNDIWQRVAINKNKAWQNCDLLNYLWWLNKKNNCKKWILLEADVRCNMNLKEFWGNNWNDPFVVAGRAGITEGEWYWKKEYNHLPESYKPYYTGIMPFTVILINDDVLTKMVKLLQEEYLDVFCEVRFPTLANRVGYPPKGFKNYKGNISFQKLQPDLDITQEGLWHPVRKWQ